MFPYSTDTSNYYQYFLADHLGNTRLSFDTPHDTLKVEQQDDYMPFGMEIAISTAANPKNEYLYNRKELQESTGLYDYGARFYDPVVARFTTLDPLAEISRRFSPYDYGEDNSIRNIDLDGMETGDSVDQLLTGIGDQFVHESDVRAAKRKQQQQGGGDGGKGEKKGKADKNKQSSRKNYHGQYLIPASEYDYSKDVIPGKASEDLEYVFDGPGGFFDIVDRYADILRRDIYAAGNKTTVEEADDVGTVFTGIVPIVQFGSGANSIYHAIRHLQDAGMDPSQIEGVKKAILDDLPNISSQMKSGSSVTVRTIDVNGVQIQYNAFKLSNGTINIGSIKFPK